MTITTKPTAPIVQTPVPEPAKSPDSTASGAANARASVPAKLTPKAPTVQAAQQPKVAPPTIKDGFAPIGAMGPRKTAATFAAGTTSALAKTEDTNITNISQMKFGQKAPAGLMKAADIKETVNAALAKSSYATQIGAFVTGHDPLKDTFGVESTATSRIPKAGSFYNVKSMADHGAVVTKAYSELYTGLSPEKTEIRKAHITRALVMINANIATEKELSTVLSKSSSSIDISTPKGEAAATVMRDGMLLKNMSLASQHPAKMGTFMLPSKEFMHEAVKAFGDTNPDGSYIELSEKEFPIMSDLFGSVEEFTKARDGQVSAWDKKRNAEVKKATAASAG
ncbi:hypothetical protein KAI87_00070, partial [Myxococcota bacterium]|nr:hypothetical protein [Myxococcota bacterium]